jgi:hypothetical protein
MPKLSRPLNWTLGILLVLGFAFAEVGVYFQDKRRAGYWIANGIAAALIIIAIVLLRLIERAASRRRASQRVRF